MPELEEGGIGKAGGLFKDQIKDDFYLRHFSIGFALLTMRSGYEEVNLILGCIRPHLEDGLPQLLKFKCRFI